MSKPHTPEGARVRWTPDHSRAVGKTPEPTVLLARERERDYWAAGKLVDGGPVPPKGRSV
jgi:hypothetical protein